MAVSQLPSPLPSKSTTPTSTLWVAMKCLTHYILSSTVLLWTHEKFFSIKVNSTNNNNNDRYDHSNDVSFRRRMAGCILLYFLTIAIWRFTMCFIPSKRKEKDDHDHDHVLVSHAEEEEQSIHHQAVLYEMTWMCNITLCIPSCVLLLYPTFYSDTNPTFIVGHLIAVSIDQILWYVDILGCVLYFVWHHNVVARVIHTTTRSFGKHTTTISRPTHKSQGSHDHYYFCIGVAAYLFWPETNWKTRITCTHHLWTIPLLLHVLFYNHASQSSKNVMNMSTHHEKKSFLFNTFIQAYFFSICIVVVHVCLSRWLTPCHLFWTRQVRKSITRNNTSSSSSSSLPNVKYSKQQQQEVVHVTSIQQERYLNINLSHTVWKDIQKFSFLAITYDCPSTCIYLIRLILRWILLNGIITFLVLYPYCIYVYDSI